MHPDEIYEIEDLFLNNNNFNPIPSGESFPSRPNAPLTNNSNNDSLLISWLLIDKKLIIGAFILCFLLGFIFSKILSK